MFLYAKLICFSALTAVAQDLTDDPLIFVAQSGLAELVIIALVDDQYSRHKIEYMSAS